MSLHACIDGVGLLGPGLEGWEEGRAILSGQRPYLSRPLVPPPPAALPPAERRRAGTLVKVALAAASEAIAGCPESAGEMASEMASVFASSGADGDNCHAICAALASADRLISPTRFHNSVHNAPSGYWSIAANAMTPSSVVCAFDASFGAGLIEALALMQSSGRHCLLVAYESPYPEPLNRARPLPSAFSLALLLAPSPGPHSLARLTLDLVEEVPDLLPDAGLDVLRRAIPSARGLPLLAALATLAPGDTRRVVLEYLAPLSIAVAVAPC
jgi:hypothetical protein